MPGVKTLQRLQFGKESTNGTAVAATARMMFNGGMLDDQREIKTPDMLVGLYGPVDIAYVESITAALEIADTPLTPEQFPYLLAASFGGPVTGTADGSGSSGYKYVTTIPVDASSSVTNTSYSVEGGDNYEVMVMDYGKVIKWTVKGTARGTNLMSASMIGQSVTPISNFASTSLVSPNNLVFGGSKLYLDAIGGTAGTTAITNQFFGYEITGEAMWVPKFTGEGSPDTPVWSFALFTNKKITGKITLEHDEAANGSSGLFYAFQNNTPKLMRIDCLGQAYATAGTSTTFTGGKRGVRFDLPIRITKAPPLEDNEGNNLRTFEFVSNYNTTAATAGTITVCNEVSALP